MGNFKNEVANNGEYKKTPEYAVKQYNIARSNLLTALILTVVNILLGSFGANIYMLFSISFPYFMFDITDIVWSIPAVIVLGVYIVYYLCSKKKPGFMIAALVTFIFDFLFLIVYSLVLSAIPETGISIADFIIDYLTHIWVLVYLIIGAKYSKRYKLAIKDDPSLVLGSAFKNATIPQTQLPEETVNFAEETSSEDEFTEEQSSDNP